VYQRGHPVTWNDPALTRAMLPTLELAAGGGHVEDIEPSMGAEDFAYLLQARPGAYLLVGQGETPMCHHPAYDFNDEIAPVGASLYARLVERALPVE
jgi:hippurate hydrolase